MATDQCASPSPLLLLLLSLLIGAAAALASRRRWPFQRCFSSHRCCFSLSDLCFLIQCENNDSLHSSCWPYWSWFWIYEAKGNNILPSVSLVFSCMLIIAGGILISCGAPLGVFLQWVIQFFSLLLPATINLAFVHIASFTDLCFSSLILGATAGLSCK